MTDSRSLTGIFVFIGILLFGLWLGVSIVTDQIETLMYVAAGGTLITCALLGRKIWLILPFAGALNLTLMIPGEPNTLLLAQALFIGFCVLQFLIRRLNFKIQITELEIWIILLTLCVTQVYIRNPIGLNIFGGTSVGGRPYAIFGLALVTCLLLGSLRVSSADLLWILRLSIIGGLINFTLSTIGYFIPKVGVWYGSAEIKSLSESIHQDGIYGANRASRIGFIGIASRNISLWVSAFKSPIRACFHPLWAPLILLSFAFSALSGYRTEIALVGLTYLIGIAYRGGSISVIIASVSLMIGILMLALLNLAAPLPSNMQRALSFLPGTWDETHVEDAEGSTEWRLEMWEAALFTEHWINNKILGDGLGMTQQEMTYIANFDERKLGNEVNQMGLSFQQEFMMASGAYHSGPVSTIRIIGYVGLLVLISAQIRLAGHAHNQIKRAKSSVWFPLTLFIGIPIITAPFIFIFIFGDFSTASASFLLGAAMVRLLENNLPLPNYIKGKRSTHQSGQLDSPSSNI